ncbi:MAG: alanine dehydrogenase, partial [Pseudomonadota bacterium]
VKVKEPQASEYELITKDHILFTYLHLAAEPELTKALIKSKCVAIAYETITHSKGGLPLLKPMSEVAGRMSIQQGCYFLEKTRGGAGILLGGIPGVVPANVTVVGGGIAGLNAARMAMGMGAQVSIIDISLDRLQQLDDIFGPRLTTIASSPSNIARAIEHSDLVVGSVLIPGKSAPKLVSEAMIKTMRPGSVVVDIAIDQGGCFETSKPTSHDHPTYEKHKVIHYCVTNMPGAVAYTSTLGLTNATFPFVCQIANHNTHAMHDNHHLANGLNVCQGRVSCKAVAEDLGYPYEPVTAF